MPAAFRRRTRRTTPQWSPEPRERRESLGKVVPFLLPPLKLNLQNARTRGDDRSPLDVRAGDSCAHLNVCFLLSLACWSPERGRTAGPSGLIARVSGLRYLDHVE